MSRRDTIIIAVLINASILAFLFVMAVNTDSDVIIEQPEITQTATKEYKEVYVQKEAPILPLTQINTSDEVDNMLKDLSMSELPQPVIIDDDYAPPEEVKKDPAKIVEIIVKRGDVLSKIAQANNTTVNEIKKLNNLSSEKLTIGQVLQVPVGTKKVVVAEKPVPQILQPGEEPQYYVIKSGDNPWKIAKQFHVKFEDLLKLNELNEEKARNLKVGDKIRVK